MRIFVTGGAGYVGSACLRHLTSSGHTAIAYDDLSQGHRAAVGGAELIVADIADTDRLTQALREFRADAVMHFAAATYVGESVTDPEFHYRNNIGGTLSLLNAMRAAGVRRMLFSSTCATYGETPQVPDVRGRPPGSLQPLRPHQAGRRVDDPRFLDGLSSWDSPFCGTSTPPEPPRTAATVRTTDRRPTSYRWCSDVALGRSDRIRVFGDDYPTPDGTCIRDYVHVDDLASAHLLAIEATRPETREVFNVGTGQGQSVRDIIAACESVAGKKIPCEVVERRPGDAPALVADPTKLMSRLDWRPRYTSIEETVATAWRWHRSNPDGYADRE